MVKHQTRTVVVLLLIALVGLAACARTEERPPVVGGDKDVHGCLPSAGYSWCDAKSKCLRTWEEPCESGKLQAIDCTDPRPTACTKEYLPVCGQKNDSTSATYGNKCTACVDAAVLSYVNGACAEAPSGMPSRNGTGPGRLAFTECKDPRPEICTMEYNPVCAEVDNGIRCIRAPCPSTDRKTFATGCTACANASVIGFWPGGCEDGQPLV